MKKRTKIMIISLVVLILLLFVPIPTGRYKDGGTRMYTALTYKIVKWQVLIGQEGRYENTSVFWYPDNFRSYEELWATEKEKMQ